MYIKNYYISNRGLFEECDKEENMKVPGAFEVCHPRCVFKL